VAWPFSPITTDLTDDEVAWKQLLDIVSKTNGAESRPQTPQHQEAIEQVATQEIAAVAAIVNGIVEEISSRCATPDFQKNEGSQSDDEEDNDDIESIHEESPTVNNNNNDDDDEIVSTPSTVPSTPIVTPSKKTKRDEQEEEDICVDLRSSSDDDDNDNNVESEPKQLETPISKRRKIVVEAADDDSDDDEEVVRVMFYNGGEFSKVEKSSTLNQMKQCFEKNNVKVVSTIQSVSNKICTLFCVFDDTYVEAKKEIVNNSYIVNLAMEGRVRMTPLSSLISIIDECGTEQLNLDALRHCSYERRREIVKFKAYVDTGNMVHSRWRLTPGAVVFPKNTPIIKTKQELLLYLRDQLFISSK